MNGKELNIGISKLRTNKGVSAKLLTNGICSQSFLTDFENGKKDIDGLMFDNILQRLGVSVDGYTCYHSKSKIECIRQRNNIINLIEDKKFVEAEQEVEKYRRKYWNKNNIHKQFILHMESRLLILKENDFEFAYEKLMQAITYTIPEVDKKKLFRLIIGFNELFLIIESLKIKSKICNDISIYEKYEEIIEYIKISEWEDLLKIRIYNKVICLVSEYWLVERMYEKVLDHCNKAIEYIRDTGKIYFISDILKFKIKSLEGLIDQENNSLFTDLCNLTKYNQEYEMTIEWKKFIDDLFFHYGTVDELYEWQPYYNAKEVHSIGSVIKRRREMLRHSHEQLSDEICEVNTLFRIENGTHAPRPKTAKSLLNKLNISNDIYVTDVVSDDFKLNILFNKLNSLLHTRRFDETVKLLDLLKNKLDHTNLVNKQYFLNKITSAFKNLNLISKEKAIKDYEDALYLTLPKDLDLRDKNIYLTKREIILLINIAITAEELGDNTKALDIYKILESYFNNLDDDIKNQIIIYEIFTTDYQSFLGNENLFQEANEINKQIITLCLKLRRGYLISDLLYSQAYNFRKLNEQKIRTQDMEKDLYRKKLNESYIMACIMNDKFSVDFLNKKIKEL